MQDESSEKNVNPSVVGFEGASFLDFRCANKPSQKASSGSANGISSSSNDSQDSETNIFENPKNTASLIRWRDHNNTYPILGAYGGPSYIHPTKYCCVIGTVRGPIMIFSVKQILLSRLVPQMATSKAENDYVRSEVTHIAVSLDGTHLAATYQSGDIFIWNLNSSEGYDSQAMTSNPISEPLKAILHITNHHGKVINGVGFVGNRHTALVASDDSGQVLFHNGYRSRFWSLTYNSRSIVQLPQRQLLRSKLAPSSVTRNGSQLIAVLTRTNIGIVSLDSKPVTLFMSSISAKNSAVPLTNSCLSWSEDGTLLALSLNNNLSVFTFNLSDSPTLLKKLSSRTNESIISLQWVSDQLLGVLTVSHELTIVDLTDSFRSVVEIDLLMYDLLIPPDRHVAVRDNEIYALTQYSLKIGKFATWLDVTLYRVQKGDYIGALNFFETLLKLQSPISKLIRLEIDQGKKEDQLGRPFFNLALAALKFIFEGSNVEYDELYQLFSTVLRIIRLFQDQRIRSNYLDSFLGQSLEFFDESNVEVLYEVLVNYVASGLLTALPPVVFKSMLEFYARRKQAATVQELIITLNPEMLDIDLAVKICKLYGLFDVLVYIWTRIFGDYLTPFVDALGKISEMPEESNLFENMRDDEVEKIYDYLSFTLTGRHYPDGAPFRSRDTELQAKIDLYQIIFSGSCLEWPPNSSWKLRTKKEVSDEPAFPYFNLLLRHSPFRCLSTFNEAFEDSYLNDSEMFIGGKTHKPPISRQTIIYIMLDMIRKKGNDGGPESTLLAIFISSNASKYPQFIRLSKQDFEKLIDVLCQADHPSFDTDIQRALESILTLYEPSNINQFIKILQEKNFTRVLFNVYFKEERFVDLFLLTLGSEDPTRDFGVSLTSITQLVLNKTKEDPLTHGAVTEIIEESFSLLLSKLGFEEAAALFDKFDSQLHHYVTTVVDKSAQLEYLDQVFKVSPSHHLDQEIKKLYIDLKLSHSDKKEALSWLDKVDLKSVDTQYILNLLETNHKHEEAYVIHYRLEMFTSVVDDMLCCINQWFQSDDQSYETLDKYLTAATNAATLSKQDTQLNWTKLIACLFNLVGSGNANASQKSACNQALQKVFVKLAVAKDSLDERETEHLEEILTNVLEHPDIIMKRVKDLKELLHDIFTAYKIELHISKLILKILEKSSTGMVSYYKDHVQEGQSVHNRECVICGKTIWGLALDTKVFEMWEAASRKSLTIVGEGNSAIILFFCRHSFHRNCLENLGQHADAYFCLTCTSDT